MANGSSRDRPLGRAVRIVPCLVLGRRRAASRSSHRYLAERGFSLLEVLVAFTILALSLGVLMQVFSQALNAATLSGTYGRATALAEAGMDLVGIDIPLEPGLQSGETEDGLHWRVQVTEVSMADLLLGESSLPVYLVSSEVTWESVRGVRRVNLATLRLGDTVPEG